MQDAAVHYHRAQRGVGPAVENKVDLHRGDGAVVFHPGALAGPDRMAFGGEQDILMAVVNNFHRLTAFQGQQRAVPGDQGGKLLFAAKRAAHRGLFHADFFEREIQGDHQLRGDVIRTLQAALNKDAAVFFGNGENALRFDIQLLLMPGPVFAFDDFVRGGEPVMHIAFGDRLRGHLVQTGGILMIRGDDFAQCEDGGQRFDFRANVRGGLAGQRAGRGGNQGHRFAPVLDFIVGDKRHVAAHQIDNVFAGNVLRGDNTDAVKIERGIKHEANQATVRYGRADDLAEPGIRNRNIVGVLGQPLNFFFPVQSFNALPDIAVGTTFFYRHNHLVG